MVFSLGRFARPFLTRIVVVRHRSLSVLGAVGDKASNSFKFPELEATCSRPLLQCSGRHMPPNVPRVRYSVATPDLVIPSARAALTDTSLGQTTGRMGRVWSLNTRTCLSYVQ